MLLTSVIAQEKEFTIKGVIIDGAYDQPIPGASIMEKGTKNGVVSDFDGKFKLSVKNKKATIIISYMGYTTQEVLIEGNKELRIVLETSASGLDEVVVVAYGSQKKISVVGAISTIAPAKLRSANTTKEFILLYNKHFEI